MGLKALGVLYSHYSRARKVTLFSVWQFIFVRHVLSDDTNSLPIIGVPHLLV